MLSAPVHSPTMGNPLIVGACARQRPNCPFFSSTCPPWDKTRYTSRTAFLHFGQPTDRSYIRIPPVLAHTGLPFSHPADAPLIVVASAPGTPPETWTSRPSSVSARNNGQRYRTMRASLIPLVFAQQKSPQLSGLGECHDVACLLSRINAHAIISTACSKWTGESYSS